jgi:hypothetical protein
MSEQLQIHQAFSIFCGVLIQPGKKINSLPDENFSDWVEQVEKDQSGFLLSNLPKFYYQPFVASMFPERFGNTTGEDFLHKRKTRFRHKLNLELTLSIRGQECPVIIEYLDLYLFPDDISIVAFKVIHLELNPDKITLVNNHIRFYERFPEFSSMASLLEKHFRQPTVFEGNKLKVFSFIEHSETNAEKINQWLYDFGTCSPPGTAAGKFPEFEPSQEYLNELISGNTISVFSTWKALCLFDTFTVMTQKGYSLPFVWEYSYFSLIYLHSLYVKYFLFDLNRRFHESGESRVSHLEKTFRSFDHHFNLKTISFNFLPQLVYEKVRSGLQIEQEMEILSRNLSEAHNRAQSRKEGKLRGLLALIALLTIITTLLDGSELIKRLFYSTDGEIITGTLILAVAILLFVATYFFLIRKK